jgi:hypothetical protein
MAEVLKTAVKIFQKGKELVTLDGSRAGISRQLIATLESAIKGNLSAVSMQAHQSFNIDGESVEGSAPEILLSFIKGMDNKKEITFQVITGEGKVSQETTLEGIELLAQVMPYFTAYSTREKGGRGEKTHSGLNSILNRTQEEPATS